MPTRKLGSYFDSNPALQSLVKEASRLIEMQKVFAAIAPPPLARSGRVGRFAHGSLLLLADNGAVAAKLLQLVPSLLVKFQKRGYEVTAIRVTAQPPSHAAVPHKNMKLSHKARAYLSKLASGLPATPLRIALEKMAEPPLDDNDQPFQDKEPQDQGGQNDEKPE